MEEDSDSPIVLIEVPVVKLEDEEIEDGEDKDFDAINDERA